MSTGERHTPIPAFGQLGRETWLTSLRTQLRQLSEERRQPPAKLELTSQRDPAALSKLVDTESSFISLIGQIRTAVAERRHPPTPVEVTAAPVEIPAMWSPYRGRSASLASLGLHLVVGLLLIFPFFAGTAELPEMTETFIPLYLPPAPQVILPPEPEQSGGGGGGGLQTETPPSQGALPRAAEEQFVPPTPEVTNPDPILVVEPTIVVPQMANLPRLDNLLLLGIPDGIPGPPSAGPGIGGGIGTGQGHGVGEGEGPGLGEGEGGGTGGGVFNLGGGVTPPTVLLRIEPEYSEDARRARHQGTVVLEAIVRRDGSVEILGVAKGLGYGLDENAIAALNQWKFNPGKKDGEAVDVHLSIEVNFTLR